MGRLLQSHANGPRADVKRPITLASGFSDSEKRKKLGEALDLRDDPRWKSRYSHRRAKRSRERERV